MHIYITDKSSFAVSPFPYSGIMLLLFVPLLTFAFTNGIKHENATIREACPDGWLDESYFGLVKFKIQKLENDFNRKGKYLMYN